MQRSLRPHPDSSWWTGAAEAHLDLALRWWPRYLRHVYRVEPKRRRLRIWHAGYEDGSQTLVLAAGVDSAIENLMSTAPRMRGWLTDLEVQVTATDPYSRLQRRGRQLRFGDGPGVRSPKAPLLPEDLGAEYRPRAVRAVARLQASRGGGARAYHERLAALVDAGHLGLLLSTVLARGARGYRLTGERWSLSDPANGDSVAALRDGRTMSFERGDLVRDRGPRGNDLVVCTCVLPYLPLYNGTPKRDLGELGRAVRNLAGAVRRGGTLLLDASCVDRRAWGDALADCVLAAAAPLVRHERQLAVTGSSAVRRVPLAR